MKLQGMFALAATPFDHTGAIYRTKVQHNFTKWRRTSLAGFIVGSPAGEGPLLEAAEKVELIKLAAAGAGESLLIADVTQEGVHGAVRLSHAVKEAGAHVVISLAPHEYRHLPNAEALPPLYFRALADQSPVPVLIHNAPVVTGIDLSAVEIARLAEHPNIVGVLESASPCWRAPKARCGTRFAPARMARRWHLRARLPMPRSQSGRLFAREKKRPGSIGRGAWRIRVF
jgi:4-hydroxy-2-oxoglutarate aldolase